MKKFILYTFLLMPIFMASATENQQTNMKGSKNNLSGMGEIIINPAWKKYPPAIIKKKMSRLSPEAKKNLQDKAVRKYILEDRHNLLRKLTPQQKWDKAIGLRKDQRRILHNKDFQELIKRETIDGSKVTMDEFLDFKKGELPWMERWMQSHLQGNGTAFHHRALVRKKRPDGTSIFTYAK